MNKLFIKAVLGWVVLWLASCVTIAAAKEPPVSQVTLSLEEYKKLFSAAHIERGERRIERQQKAMDDEQARIISELLEKSNQIKRAEQRALFPENHMVLDHWARGFFNSSSPDSGAERDVASFDFGLAIRILEPQWTVVPLVNANSTVTSDWSIAWRPSSNGQEDFEAVNVTWGSADTMILQKDGQLVLATNRSGLFRVQFQAHTRVQKTRNLHQVGLSTLLYPLSDFSFRVVGKVREFSAQPASAVLKVQPSNEGELHTNVKVALPLTADSIDVRWLEIDKDEEMRDGKGAGENDAVLSQLLASDEVLHTVGEGVVRSSHILEFSAANEMPPSVRFKISGENVRIASIKGHSLHHWKVLNSNNTKVVQAVFKSSHLELSATLLVATEADLSTDPKQVVVMPRIECPDAFRQLGHVAVTKDANVEVHEYKTRALAPCEPAEVSSQLRLNTDRPLVLSYKYFTMNNSLTLAIKQHVAMTTLEATADRVHYKAVVTNTHTIHSLILVLQSTKLQYLDLHGLPGSASMFSLSVNSVPTKPVIGEDSPDSILIPLLVGQDPAVGNEGGTANMKTYVEVNYVSAHDELGFNGTLLLSPPRISLPISVLTTHVRLPDKFEYKFSGNFSDAEDRLAYPLPLAFSYKTGNRVVEKEYKFSGIDDVWAEQDKQKVSPIMKIATPNTGQSFYFHRLLVLDLDVSLRVAYSKPAKQTEKSWWLNNIFGYV